MNRRNHLTTQLLPLAGILATGWLPACKVKKADESESSPSSSSSPTTQSGEQKEKKIIGMTLMTYNNPFFAVIKSVARKTVEAKGMEFREHDAQLDSNKQAAAIEDFLAQGVDAILLNPVDSAAIVKSVEKANAKGVPVVAIDVKSEGGKLATFVASDNFQLGVMTGKYLVKRLQGKGKIAMLTHPLISSGRRRGEGAMSVLKEHPGIEIVAEQATRGERLKSMEVAENILTANPDLDAVWAINDPTALGAIQAIKQAKRDDKIFVVGVDGSPEAVSAIKEGHVFAATAAQYPDKMAERAVLEAINAMEGKQQDDFIPILGSLVTKNNADSYAGWKE